MQLHSAYGAVQHGEFEAQSKPSRFRINFYSPLLCLLLPWALFMWMFWVHSFKMHYEHPTSTLTSSVVGLIIVSCLGFMTVDRLYNQKTAHGQTQPSWIVFLFLTCAPAYLLGIAVGEYNYEANMKPYYDVANLNSYMDVDPVAARGQQLMDAGRIVFTEGAHLDLKHSMGFMKEQVYCVAPVTTTPLDGNSSGLAVLDFWAIGKNCCSGSQGGDFRCGAYADKHARGGLRLLSASDQTYYRLAVQQAEAAYDIKAVHPIFLYWMPDPMSEVDAYKTSGSRLFTMGVIYFFVAQLAFVILALLLISKLART